MRSQYINVQESEISATDSLQPIIEAAQLLQANKSNDDVELLCSMCSMLTSAQVVKLLNMGIGHAKCEVAEKVPELRGSWASDPLWSQGALEDGHSNYSH